MQSIILIPKWLRLFRFFTSIREFAIISKERIQIGRVWSKWILYFNDIIHRGIRFDGQNGYLFLLSFYLDSGIWRRIEGNWFFDSNWNRNRDLVEIDILYTLIYRVDFKSRNANVNYPVPSNREELRQFYVSFNF